MDAFPVYARLRELKSTGSELNLKISLFYKVKLK